MTAIPLTVPLDLIPTPVLARLVLQAARQLRALLHADAGWCTKPPACSSATR